MSWLGLNTSVTGMFTSQRKLYTVNHNVSNAEREGYSRQRVKSSATVPLHISGKGYIGTGIGVDSVERVRDLYVDKKLRTETASLGNWDMKNSALSEIEGVLRGSKEEGININIDQLFAAIEDLSTNPSNMSYRVAFREKAVTLTKTLNETVNRLYKQQKDLNFEIKTKIKQVNDYADQLSSLNSEIFAMEVDGSNANDLRDQRDLIVDKLSKLVDIEAEERIINVEESKDGKSVVIKKFEVRIGGISLVDHNMTSKLKYPPDRMPNTLNPEESLYKVEWESGGALKLKGGEIKGLLEIRDGGYQSIDETTPTPPTTLVKAEYQYTEANGIPYYIKRLDEFAQVFAEKMNDIHSKGINLKGNTGVLLFDTNKPYGETTISSLGDVRIESQNGKSVSISSSGDVTVDLGELGIGTIDFGTGKITSGGVEIGTLQPDGTIKNNQATPETVHLDFKIINDGAGKTTIEIEDYKIIRKTDGSITYEKGLINEIIFSGTVNEVTEETGVDIKNKASNIIKDSNGNLKVGSKKYKDHMSESIRADSIKLSSDIVNDLNNIATIDSTDKDNIENNGIMKEMLEAREKTDFFSGTGVAYQGKPEDYLTSVLSTLGTDNQQAQRMEKVQGLIVKGAINQRLSISGVNLDEEMADMVKFQQIFNASAKMVSTFDQIYDTMINRLGMVGR